jgi:hypothetical protein
MNARLTGPESSFNLIVSACLVEQLMEQDNAKIRLSRKLHSFLSQPRHVPPYFPSHPPPQGVIV